MKNQEAQMTACLLAIADIGPDEAYKRLRPSVSGAEPCYAGCEAAAERGVAEARSEEGRRVTPVEVKEAVEWALDALESHMNECAGHVNYLKAIKNEKAALREMALVRKTHERISRTFKSLLPEPESEACRNQSASHETPAPNMPADAEPPRDERSGRRNAKTMP